MATVITMPKLSDTMEEGAIAEWLKKEGEFVEEGEILAEIETDKATMEYESPEEGVLFKIIIAKGDKGDVGVPMAILAEEGEKPDVNALVSGAGSEKAESADTPQSATPTPSSSESSSSSAPMPASTDGSRKKASPLARKIAAEKGVDLNQVEGTGPNGRVVARDLEAARPASGVTSAPMTSSAAPAASTKTPIEMPSMPSFSGEDQVQNVSMMRKTIAKRLHAAKNDAPHFYLTRTIDMSATIAWRKKLNEKANPEAGVPKVSFNDIVMLATAKALRKHPEVNSSWEGDQIRTFASVSIAMAVALPTGLVTPVLKNTDQMGVRDIAKLTKAFAAKARAGQLTNEDFAGGTFTISNLGMAGIDEFTAIINPPQAAILAVGSTKKIAVVDEKTDEIVARPMMKVTMSCDHRVVDGWVGAQFLETLVQNLEDPMMMLS